MITVYMAKKTCQWRRPFGVLSKVVNYNYVQLSILETLTEMIMILAHFVCKETL